MTEFRVCRELLPQCFTGGFHFAGDQKSQEGAVEYLRCLVENTDVWLEAEQHIRDYLRLQNVPDNQINSEIERARERIAPWLP